MVPLSTIKPKTILLRFPNWIGDIVMATPLLHDIREHYPDAEITVMCSFPLCEILEKDPHISELFCFHRKEGVHRRFRDRDVIEKLRRGKYDLGILLTNSLSSAWLFWQGHVKRRLGYKNEMRSLFLTDAIAKEKTVIHQVESYKKLLEPLGIPLSKSAPKLYLSEDEREEAKERLLSLGIAKGEKWVGVNPGAAFGSAKCWPPERFRTVAQKLAQENIPVIFFGGSEMRKSVQEMVAGLGVRVISLAGETKIRELMALISCAALFLTNDSGPMHIADALGVPVIALFGSTSSQKTRPYNQGSVIEKNVSCSPCFKRTCPIDFRCMKNIEVDEVFEKVKGAIQR